MRISKIQRFASYAAFSLVEILIAILLIGILAGISLPFIVPVRTTALANKSMRNAQTLAACAGAAQAAGANLDLASIESVAAQLRMGVIGAGVFTTTTFKVAPFSDQEIEAFKVHLAISHNTLVFQPR